MAKKKTKDIQFDPDLGPEGADISEHTDTMQSEGVPKLWRLVCPELIQFYPQLTQEVRDGIYDEHVARLAARGPATASPDGSTLQRGAPEQAMLASSPPPVPEIPKVDLALLQQDMRKAFEEQDADLFADAQHRQLQFYGALAENVAAVQAQQSQALQGFDRQLQRPGLLRRARAMIEGCTEADEIAALELIDSGKVSDIGTALQYAVDNRNRAAAAGQPFAPTPGSDATRRASAIAASDMAAPSRSLGESPGATPVANFESEEGEALVRGMEEEVKEKQK